MPTDTSSPRLCAYQAQRCAIQREYEAKRRVLWDAYIDALRDAEDDYTAAVTPNAQEDAHHA